MKRLLALPLLATLVLVACKPKHVPRPKTYPRVEIPTHGYAQFESNSCPFVLEYPDNGELVTNRIDSCYVDIYFPELKCTWHITTRDLAREGASMNRAYEDYRSLVYQHSGKANNITETRLQTAEGSGTFFEVYGEVPTPGQVFFTDTSRFAFIASFYFDTATKNDSLAPVIQYMKQELIRTTESLKWR